MSDVFFFFLAGLLVGLCREKRGFSGVFLDRKSVV